MIISEKLKFSLLCSKCRNGFEKLITFAPHKFESMLKMSLKILRLIGMIIIGAFLSSCNTSIEIAKRHYQSGYYISIHKKHNDSKQSVTKVAKEHLQPINLVALLTDNNPNSIIDNPRAINDNQIASNDNSTPIILNNKIDFTTSENSTADNYVSTLNNETSMAKPFSNGSGDVGYYLSRWLIYLGLAIVATICAILLLSSSAQGFCILLFIIGGACFLLAIIDFIKWVSFL